MGNTFFAATGALFVVALGAACGGAPEVDENDENAMPLASAEGDAEIARGKPATASSTESGGFGAANVNDGRLGTRWASRERVDPQWVQIDLRERYAIGKVVLRWEAAFARAFRIEVSDDAATWQAIYSTTTGDGGEDALTTNGSGRYIRMYGTQRGTGWGYSLFEMAVYGRPASTTPPTEPPPTEPPPTQPPATGFPNASNTGVPAGTTLRPSGSIVVTQDNTVLDALDITGDVRIQARNVTIRRSKIHGGGIYGVFVASGNVLIEDSELWGFGDAAIGFSNWTARRVNIHGVGADGVKLGSDVLLEDSYFHDFTPKSGAHADGGQVQGGVVNVTVRHNTIVGASNAALFIAPDLGPSSAGPLLITNNLFGGGNYTVQIVDGNNGRYFIQNITFTNNRFQRNAQYGPLRCNVPVTQSGNVFDNDGSPIPKC